MIDHAKARTNRELLEAATSFSFGDIYIHVVQVHGSEWVEIRKAGNIYDKKTGKFVNLVNKYAVIDGRILDTVDCQFTDVYEAFEVVKELVK